MDLDNIFEIKIILLLVLMILCIVIRLRKLSNMNEVGEHFNSIIEHLDEEEIIHVDEENIQQIVEQDTRQLDTNTTDIKKIESKINTIANNKTLDGLSAINTTLVHHTDQINELTTDIAGVKVNVQKNTTFIDALSKEINKFEKEVQGIEKKAKKKK
jgi:predicted  nucleic acid-binding Zn-ribbon protein